MTVCNSNSKYNQSGFCKFRKDCRKRHEDEICTNVVGCVIESCTKRHPKECKQYKDNGKCYFGERCAYQHREDQLNQNSLNEMIGACMVKHQNDIKELFEEIKHLKDIIQIMNEKVQSLEQNNKDKQTENDCNIDADKDQKYAVTVDDIHEKIENAENAKKKSILL